MSTRDELVALALVYLGTAADDPMYPAATMALLAQQAYDQTMQDVTDVAPEYLSKSVTLAADSATAVTYTFATQAPPITDFRRALELRWTDYQGRELRECRSEELYDAGLDYFAVTGTDDAPTLSLSARSPGGTALFLRYAYWPAAFLTGSSTPDGIPSRYHDVLALRMAELAYGLGGEASFPPNLARILSDRMASLLANVSRRSTQPQRMRLDPLKQTLTG